MSSNATTRRDLLRTIGILGGTAILSRGVFACASDPPTETPVTEGESSLVSCQPPVIGNNHGHRLVVSPAEVDARQTKTYAIQGTSGHGHDVTISAEHFALLGAGRTIVVSSTTTFGHAHDVTVTCTAAAGDAGSDAKDGDASVDAVAPVDASDAGKTDAADAAMPEAAPTVCPNGGSSTISANHGHALTVPRSDVLAGEAKTYSIQGDSGHDHAIRLTSADFATLVSGTSVTVVSDGATHTHTVTVTCA